MKHIFNEKKKKSFTLKLFMECNKAHWFNENNSLWKSFRSLAKKLMSRIWDIWVFQSWWNSSSIRHIKKSSSFFSFISLSSSPNRNLCAFTQTYTYICEDIELLSFLLCYCHLLFFCSLCLLELGYFPHSQWFLEKGSFFIWGPILVIHLNFALQ